MSQHVHWAGAARSLALIILYPFTERLDQFRNMFFGGGPGGLGARALPGALGRMIGYVIVRSRVPPVLLLGFRCLGPPAQEGRQRREHRGEPS